MNKQQRLDKMEELFENRLIDLLESDQTEKIPELATVGNWLAKNAKVAEKQRDTVEDEIKKRLEEAKRRREAGAST